MNLNEVVLGATENYFTGSEVELDLSNELKKDYDGDILDNLHVALSELASEIKEHRGKQRKIHTRIDPDNSEILEILSSGPQLSNRQLELLASRYKEGYKEKPAWGSRGGSRYIAYHLGQIGAIISTQNINEGVYTVKNTVEIS